MFVQNSPKVVTCGFAPGGQTLTAAILQLAPWLSVTELAKFLGISQGRMRQAMTDDRILHPTEVIHCFVLINNPDALPKKPIVTYEQITELFKDVAPLDLAVLYGKSRGAVQTWEKAGAQIGEDAQALYRSYALIAEKRGPKEALESACQGANDAIEKLDANPLVHRTWKKDSATQKVLAAPDVLKERGDLYASGKTQTGKRIVRKKNQ